MEQGTEKPVVKEEVIATPEVTKEEVTTETEAQNSAGQSEDQIKPTEISPDETQKRINKLYARLKTEENAKLETRSELDKRTAERDALALLANEEDDDDETPKSKGLTAEDVRKLLTEEKLVAKRESIEKDVYTRHPSMINEDGTFNVEDEFTKMIVQIGKEKPYLANQIDGLQTAEELAMLRLKIPYKEGIEYAKQKKVAETNAYVGTSSTAPLPKSNYKMSNAEKDMASRSGMSEDEWIKYKTDVRIT